jgi:tripartite ATP-independent transporter DctP family solute receptor
MRQYFTRRNLLAVTLGAAVALSAGVAQAQNKKVLRFSAASPPADFLSKSMQVFKDEVEKAAPGIDVQIYPASQLFRQGTEVPAMQRGTLEMNTMTTFEVSAQIEEYGFLNRAFLFRDYDHLMKVLKGPFGAAYAKEVEAKMGLVILSPGYLGTRQVNLRTARDVKGPADLAGLKMRMPATPEWLVLGQSLGVSPVPMAMPEIYLALQTGSIDGQENPLTIMNAAKFYEVTKQVVKTAHLVQPIFYTIAKPFFDKLTA